MLRVVFPIKYYKDEGFVERTIEINDDDLDTSIEEYLREHGDFDFDEVEIVNKRPMNIWLHAKCRTYIDKDNLDEPEDMQVSKAEAEVVVAGKYPESDPRNENSPTVLTIICRRYWDFGPTLAAEKLCEDHGRAPMVRINKRQR